MINRRTLLATAAAIPIAHKFAQAQTTPAIPFGIYTRSYDNQRTGANLNETILTPQAVQSKGLQTYYSFEYEGDARGTEAPILVMPNLLCSDGVKHDLGFCGTMANDVYGYDVNTGGLIWQQRIANPIVSTQRMDLHNINDHWGILSCGVIDPTTATAYVVSMGSANADFLNTDFYLHAVNLADGSEAKTAINLNAASYQSGTLPIKKFSDAIRKQRCALLLDSRNGIKTIYVCSGSFLESSTTNTGWVIACDVSDSKPMKVSAAWTTTSRYYGGGIWMGSQGPSIEPVSGDVILTVGNGAFDGITDFSESLIRLKYTPSPPSLSIVGWATPYTDTGRVAGANYQTVAAVELLPGNVPTPASHNNNSANMDNPGDEDLDSSGPVVILAAKSGLSKDIAIYAGKDGIAYVSDIANLGNMKLADFNPATIAANVYSKFLSPPYGLTFYPGQTDLTPTDLSTIPTTYGGFSHHMHSTAVYYKSKIHGNMLFCQGENAALRAFAINADFTLQFLAASVETASFESTNPPGGMPGGMLSLTANGDTDGIIWSCMPYGDANMTITQGRLIAYDAENFNTLPNGDKQLVVLWDSLRENWQFKHNKFNIVHVFNGKVFLPSYDGRTIVLQLAG
jgi:hypothetical protein